ncbi:MAG: hypothetical protein ACRDLF_15990, partial [Solirubrobacteraceae bacterium]
MRLRGLTALACAVAVSSAVLSLALLATEASAFYHPSPRGRCRVGIQAPRRITAGEPVTIFGRLVCRRRVSAADRVVKLFRHVAGTPGFALVQSTTTNEQGIYEFQPVAGPVEASSVWYVRSHGAQSVYRRTRVAPEVTLLGPPEGTQIFTGAAGKVTFTGTVTPADVGARVILQRQNALTGNEWRRIDSTVVEPGGGFTIVHTFIVPGDANLRVVVRSQGRDVPAIASLREPATSSLLSYEISQAENPALTIESSADPIPYGQSVTISGVLAGGANQPVTLLARTVHQHGFAPVAQATTDAGGNYAFPAQTPVNSTFYEVQASGPVCPPGASCPAALVCKAGPPHCGGAPPTTSAVLYEGVRFLLTAQVSATSVLQGSTLTFSGSVAPAPARPGHVIYLERQNASGQGFHVVQLSALSQSATFSIAYQVYSTGTDAFRVYIPGGPDNEAAASQLFTIHVAPAPAAALAPENPNNSSAPAEGSTSPSEGEKESEKEGEAGR